MANVQNWGEAITLSMLNLWERFVNFLPALLGALIILIFGLIVASILGKAAKKLISLLRIDGLLAKTKLVSQMESEGLSFKTDVFFGELVKWFFVLVFLMAATDILGLTQVTDFLNKIVMYVPNVIVAVVILSIAFLLGSFVYNLVRSSTRVAGVARASVIASVCKWAIVIFGLLAALIQLGIAASLVNTIFIGVVAALSLALGLAFGLGGRDEAALVLRKLREDFEEK